MKVEKIDWTKRVAHLPEKAYTGRKVKNQVIEITPELEVLVRKAIGDRETGFVFKPSRNGVRWIPDRLSRAFRKARDEAGIPPEVLIAGRGGSLNESADDDDAE